MLIVREFPDGNYMLSITSQHPLTRTVILILGVPSILIAIPWSSLSTTPSFTRPHNVPLIGEFRSYQGKKEGCDGYFVRYVVVTSAERVLY